LIRPERESTQAPHQKNFERAKQEKNSLEQTEKKHHRPMMCHKDEDYVQIVGPEGVQQRL